MRQTKALIDLSQLDIAVIIAYFVILGMIAWWSGFAKRNRSENLFLANKSLGWFAIGLTMWGTNVGPSMLIANANIKAKIQELGLDPQNTEDKKEIKKIS